MSPPKPSDPSFVTTREAAELLGVSVRTVQLWVEHGVLHAWKTVGGHRRIVRASVETVLERQREVIDTVSDLRVLKVVLIDDNPTQLKLYQLKLESLKLPIVLTVASSGPEGMLLVGQATPDVVIVSLDIGGMDVGQMIRAIRTAVPEAGVVGLTRRNRDEIAKSGAVAEDVPVLAALDDLDVLEPLLKQRLDAKRAH